MSGWPQGMRDDRRTSLQAGNTRLRVMLRFSLVCIHWLARKACVVDFSIRPATCSAPATLVTNKTQNERSHGTN